MAHVDRPARRTLAITLGVLSALTATNGCGGGDHAQAPSASAARADAAVARDVHPTRSARAKATAAAVLSTRSNGVVTPAPTRLILQLADFRIDPFLNAVPRGPVKIKVLNRGDEEHELLIVKSRGGAPPVKGGRVDEDALERKHRLIGEISEVPAGRSASKTFFLRAGSYYLLCNVPGHYRAGMRATLIVRGR
jgi:uncharacterized cupredoxin-like copper-binding protein